MIDGQKMWLTNVATSYLIALLVRTDEGAEKAHQNLTTFLVEKPTGFGEVAPGLTIPGKIDKMGYKGVDTTEAVFAGYRIGADKVLGAAPGKGFSYMMDGVEVGRVNVAARACGIAIRAFELAVEYAQQRKTLGKPTVDFLPNFIRHHRLERRFGHFDGQIQFAAMTNIDDLTIRIAGPVHGASTDKETRYFLDRFLCRGQTDSL